MSEMNVCKHCGQLCIDECDCDGAVRERKCRDYLVRAYAEIDEIIKGEDGTGAVDEDVRKLLCETAERISYGGITSVKFVLSSGVSLTFKRVAEGAIKIERSESKKRTVTVQEW